MVRSWLSSTLRSSLVCRLLVLAEVIRISNTPSKCTPPIPTRVKFVACFILRSSKMSQSTISSPDTQLLGNQLATASSSLSPQGLVFQVTFVQSRFRDSLSPPRIRHSDTVTPPPPQNIPKSLPDSHTRNRDPVTSDSSTPHLKLPTSALLDKKTSEGMISADSHGPVGDGKP